MSDPSKYTVGWICAIPTEAVAAQILLDEEHDLPSQVAPHDNNNYTLGRMGKHNVVIAVLPDGEYGLVSAAAVARDMLHSFPNVRIGLMVGIGGGAPGPKRDIRLGDVVVSSRSGGMGGVFQYDYGKAIQNQSFQETAFINQPPPVLRTAVNKLKAEYEIRGHQLADHVNEALKKIKKRKKHIRPPPESDRLYKSDFVHPSDSKEPCHVTCGNDEANLVIRGERDEEEDNPAIHYGLIASGNQLMKDALLRDKLAEEKGVLCFEMEAAGLMNHFPCLVIRGICDYSDSHKNDKWHGFAAMMAAAYAKDLLGKIPVNKVEEEKRIGEVLGLFQDSLQYLHQSAKQTQAMVAATHIENWLNPPDPSTNFNTAKRERHEGTGNWFLNSIPFNEWKDSSRRYLWLQGLAGCGKTVLSATIVEHLRKDDNLVLDFYFDFKDVAKQRIDGMLRSFLFRLYRLGCYPKQVDSLYYSYDNGGRQPDSLALTNCLCAMIKGSKAAFVVLDALDECTERRELLGWLKKFFAAPDLNHVRLLVTGRPEEELLSFIPNWIGEEHCLQLDKDAVNADIRSYVAARLENSPDFENKRLPRYLIERIHDKVGNRADGMFRWAACQLSTLAGCMSVRAIENALENLPKDLDETYHRMLRSIPEDIKKDAIRLLQFLVYTPYPLTVKAAIDVIATQTDEEPQGFDPKRRLFREADVLRYCPSLVSIIEAPTAIGTRIELHITHFSVKEYLLKQPQFDFEYAGITLARTSLRYLRAIEGNSKNQIMQDFPLAVYAEEYWMDFARPVQAAETVFQEILEFVQDDSAVRRSRELYFYATVPHIRRSLWVLPYICSGGLLEVAKKLIEQGTDVNIRDGYYSTPLRAATISGHQELVRFLLDVGADANALEAEHGTVLTSASKNGHQELVRVFLDAGVDVNAHGSKSDTALQAASRHGHREVVRLLLEAGADVNAPGGKSRTALQAASKRGYQEIVRILLDAGADVNSWGSKYGTALQAASVNGHQEVARLLLNAGADVNARGSKYGTALHAASERGHQEVVGLLLDAGADVDALDGKYGTALQAASVNGHREVVRLLLEAGADVNVRGGEYGTALHAASEGGHQEVVRLLLDKGADANTNYGVFGSALYRLLYGLARPNFGENHMRIIQLLLHGGADVEISLYVIADVCTDTGFTGRSIETLQLLLHKGANVNAKDDEYGTPLQFILGKGLSYDFAWNYIRVIRLLLEKGADVNAQGGRYGSPLQIVLKGCMMGGFTERSLEVIQILLDMGARLNAQGEEYGDVFQALIEGGHRVIVQRLQAGTLEMHIKCSNLVLEERDG